MPGRRLIQLNWMTNKAYLFHKRDLALRTEAATPLKDGWGVTHNGSALIVSDGSAQLHWLDPKTLQLLHSLQVGAPGRCGQARLATQDSELGAAW